MARCGQSAESVPFPILASNRVVSSCRSVNTACIHGVVSFRSCLQSCKLCGHSFKSCSSSLRSANGSNSVISACPCSSGRAAHSLYFAVAAVASAKFLSASRRKSIISLLHLATASSLSNSLLAARRWSLVVADDQEEGWLVATIRFNRNLQLVHHAHENHAVRYVSGVHPHLSEATCRRIASNLLDGCGIRNRRTSNCFLSKKSFHHIADYLSISW